jgi:archaellum component FlaC
MLHLAQIEKIPASDLLGLRLVATQRAEYSWAVIPEPSMIPYPENSQFREGALVLATISETNEVMQVEVADRWLVDVIQTFLKNGITPAFLQEEAERAEQWRQTLTLQGQDLDRRALELEARREQIEQLEESLKREKKQIEVMAVQYQEQTQECDRLSLEVATLREQVEKLEAELNQARQQNLR